MQIHVIIIFFSGFAHHVVEIFLDLALLQILVIGMWLLFFFFAVTD